jgi:hypothetical protein
LELIDVAGGIDIFADRAMNPKAHTGAKWRNGILKARRPL